jgi:SNF2 family DNA or RNA helicase
MARLRAKPLAAMAARTFSCMEMLVFSQFTSMLDLIRHEFGARGDAYSLLTGDTRDRAAAANDFQDGRTRVFLIGLKAGGVGRFGDE